VLQERVVESVGADEPIPVDVRVIAATNKNLASAVKKGTFREDLYYRLNVVEIAVPPLRERPEDISVLTRHFVEQLAKGRELMIPESLMQTLEAYSWPGNVRELENTCQRLVLLSNREALSEDDLPPAMHSGNRIGAALSEAWPPLPKDGLSLVDLERRVIERVLALKEGNVTQAALYLNVPRHVLAYRMEKYGIPRR
jgi:DNA-binding NtrC family response regulator